MPGSFKGKQKEAVCQGEKLNSTRHKPFLAKVVVVPCCGTLSRNHCRTKMKHNNIKICVECSLEVQKAEYNIPPKFACNKLTPFKNTSRRTPENRLLGIKICRTKSNLSMQTSYQGIERITWTHLTCLLQDIWDPLYTLFEHQAVLIQFTISSKQY